MNRYTRSCLCGNILAVFLASIVFIEPAQAVYTREIDIKAETTLVRFRDQVSGADKFLSEAKAVLVFPEIIKAGVGIGGHYGEGVLIENQKALDYFTITGVSLGLQLGGQLRSVILVFMEDEALAKFLDGNGWDIGVDGSVTLIDTGIGKTISTISIDDPVIGFLLSAKGLMFNLTLEGSRISPLEIKNHTHVD